MTCKAVLFNQHLEKLLNDHFDLLEINYQLKRNHPQFYLQKLFGKDSDVELLICLTPFEDKTQPNLITHSPYRVAIRLVQKVLVEDADAGLDDLQKAVHQVRLAMLPKTDEHNPFKDLCSINSQPFESSPVKYPPPENTVNVASAIMILEIPITEKIK